MDLARLHWAARRRGMLELDVLFERYLTQQYDRAPAEEQKLFQELLEQNDQLLFDWLVKHEPVTIGKFQGLIEKLQK